VSVAQAGRDIRDAGALVERQHLYTRCAAPAQLAQEQAARAGVFDNVRAQLGDGKSYLADERLIELQADGEIRGGATRVTDVAAVLDRKQELRGHFASGCATRLGFSASE